MATEIERKFLVHNGDWRQAADAGTRYQQGYLSAGGRCSVRVRRTGERAWLSLKSATSGVERMEFEYPIPPEEAGLILQRLANGPLIDKVRYRVPVEGHLFEIDCFEGANAGLVVAEVELNHIDEVFPRPAWLGREVSAQERYYNASLVDYPYRDWTDDERDPDRPWIRVSLAGQTLELHSGGRCVATWPVSTGRAGAGERNGSGGTPRGWHVVRARVGQGMPEGTVFRGRRPTGEIHTPELAARHPGRDWILSRILWLSGLEPGRNRLGDVDTMRRYIYIHGGPDDAPMGVAESHGCVRMRNADVIDLFERVPAGTRVLIEE